MKLYFVRHGETVENREGIVQGHLPGELTDKGEEQVQLLAERLQYKVFDKIYSSDLGRAKDTAEVIHQYHTNTELAYTEKLREGYPGNIQGMKAENTCLPEYPEDAEGMQGMKDRISGFLEEIKDKHIEDQILFVAHGGINKALLTYLKGHHASAMRNYKHQENTAVNIAEVAEDSYKVLQESNIEHLAKSNIEV